MHWSFIEKVVQVIGTGGAGETSDICWKSAACRIEKTCKISVMINSVHFICTPTTQIKL